MMFRSPLILSLLALAPAACVAPTDEAGDAGDGDATAVEAITTGDLWLHLDTIAGTGPATVSALNGATVRCPDGKVAHTCKVSALVLPTDCGWECQDGLLGGQGEAVVRGRFAHGALVIAAGYDTWALGLGTRTIYRLTAAPSCASDPCPASLRVQKLDSTAAASTVTSVDFTLADDPNYTLDPTRGDAQALSTAGLVASGRIKSHVFIADRVWRLQTPLPACDPQLTARAQVYLGDATEVTQFRTVAEAERAPAPVAWLVRTGERATASSFTSGVNDLWAQRFDVAKADCTVTVTAEH